MTNPQATFASEAARDDGRPCARGSRCSSAAVDPDSGQREPAWGPRPLCDADRDLLERVIRELPRLFVRVHQVLLVAGSGGSGGPKVSASKSPPIPLNTSADELLRLMVVTLVSWEERVRTVARLVELDTGLSRRRRDGVAVDQAARVLAPRVDALLVLPLEAMARDAELVERDGADAALEIFALAWRCRALLADGVEPARPLLTPCRCGLRQLVAVAGWDGGLDGAKCRACRREYSEVEVVALGEEMTAEARRVVEARAAEHRAQREALEMARAAELAVHHMCRDDAAGALAALEGLSDEQLVRVGDVAERVRRMARAIRTERSAGAGELGT